MCITNWCFGITQNPIVTTYYTTRTGKNVQKLKRQNYFLQMAKSHRLKVSVVDWFIELLAMQTHCERTNVSFMGYGTLILILHWHHISMKLSVDVMPRPCVSPRSNGSWEMTLCSLKIETACSINSTEESNRFKSLSWSDFGSEVIKVWPPIRDRPYKVTYSFWLCIHKSQEVPLYQCSIFVVVVWCN